MVVAVKKLDIQTGNLLLELTQPEKPLWLSRADLYSSLADSFQKLQRDFWLSPGTVHLSLSETSEVSLEPVGTAVVGQATGHYPHYHAFCACHELIALSDPLPRTLPVASGESTSDSSSGLNQAFGVPVDWASVDSSSSRNINGLLTGQKWASTSVSFSFPDSIADYEAGYPDRYSSSFRSLNVTQRAVSRAWLRGDFYNVSRLSPFELTGAADRDATVRIAMSNVPSTAFAYYPWNSVEAGDAWFNRNDYNNPVIGNYAYFTFGHEFGHSMGLKHGHERGGPANVTMAADRDSMEFSIMTYRSYVGASTTGGYTNEAWGYAQSLMMYDIAALQHMYGP